MLNYYSTLKTKFIDRNAKVGVIGLGYVGLPLAVELSKSGFITYGIDIDSNKVNSLKNKESYIIDVSNEELSELIEKSLLIPTNDFRIIENLDAVSICVPTPLTKSQEPDISYITSAVNEIKKYMHEGLLIILESTTYPGTTEELIEFELEKLGYKVGVDYFLCFSPERVDPGNKKFSTKNTPKVIGGTTDICTDLGVTLYNGFLDQIVPVSSPKVAEMSKLLENTFRSINIAFINEMAILCDRLGIDIWETIEASSTKPFGFMKFTPGPGIGGHCIPLDPMYLAWKAKGSNFYSRFIELAQEVNKTMPDYVYSVLSHALNEHKKSVNGSKILILGLAYKPDIDDLRESPGLDIYEILIKNGAKVEYNDPHALKFINKSGEVIHSRELNYNNLAEYDCVLTITNHKAYDYDMILKNAELIVDTRNAFNNNEKVYKLGAPNIISKELVEV